MPQTAKYEAKQGSRDDASGRNHWAQLGTHRPGVVPAAWQYLVADCSALFPHGALTDQGGEGSWGTFGNVLALPNVRLFGAPRRGGFRGRVRAEIAVLRRASP